MEPTLSSRLRAAAGGFVAALLAWGLLCGCPALAAQARRPNRCAVVPHRRGERLAKLRRALRKRGCGRVKLVVIHVYSPVRKGGLVALKVRRKAGKPVLVVKLSKGRRPRKPVRTAPPVGPPPTQAAPVAPPLPPVAVSPPAQPAGALAAERLDLLLAGLPSADLAALKLEVGQLGPARADGIVEALAALSAKQRELTVGELSAMLAPAQSEPQRLALLAPLLGLGSEAQRRELEAQDQPLLAATVGELARVPVLVGGADIPIVELLSEAFNRLLPHVKSLIEEAVAVLPAVARPYVLARDRLRVAQIVQTEAFEALDIVLLLQNEAAHTYIQTRKLEAEDECVTGEPCKVGKENEEEITQIAALPRIRESFQPDFVDCTLGPACSQSRREALYQFLEKAIKEGSLPPTALEKLKSELEGDVLAEPQAGITALACAGQGCP